MKRKHGFIGLAVSGLRDCRGIYKGYIRDNGKEHGSYYSIGFKVAGFRVGVI